MGRREGERGREIKTEGVKGERKKGERGREGGGCDDNLVCGTEECTGPLYE